MALNSDFDSTVLKFSVKRNEKGKFVVAVTHVDGSNTLRFRQNPAAALELVRSAAAVAFDKAPTVVESTELVESDVELKDLVKLLIDGGDVEVFDNGDFIIFLPRKVSSTNENEELRIEDVVVNSKEENVRTEDMAVKSEIAEVKSEIAEVKSENAEVKSESAEVKFEKTIADLENASPIAFLAFGAAVTALMIVDPKTIKEDVVQRLTGFKKVVQLLSEIIDSPLFLFVHKLISRN